MLATLASALCSTDIHMVERGERDLILPRIIGHEFVGEVIASDAGACEGERVQVFPGIACGECPECRRGWHNHCAHNQVFGFSHDGGMAEEVAVPAASLSIGGVNRVPEALDDAVATLAEPLGCCVNAQGLASVTRGDTVLIFGAGPMGCMHALLARLMGAGKVIMVESLSPRMAMAERAGPDAVIPPEGVRRELMDRTGGRGADVIVLATARVLPDEGTMSLLARRGRVCLFSNPEEEGQMLCMPRDRIFYRENAVVGSYGSGAADCRQALGILAEHGDAFAWLITGRFRLDDIGLAMEHMRRRRGMKAVVDGF